MKNKLAVFGLIVVGVIAVAVIIGPPIIYWTTGITPDYIPSDSDLIKSFSPSMQHPMGTDEAGRDVLARVLQGGRISLIDARIFNVDKIVAATFANLQSSSAFARFVRLVR